MWREALSGVQVRLRRIGPRTILLATWLVMLLYAFPGYMNFDSADQIAMSRGLSGPWSDWHPPLMAGYWHLIEIVVRGPFGMLVLQLSLFVWGVDALLRLRFAPRPAALLTAALCLFPPILTPMAVVWKDAQMAGFLVAGTALALRGSWRARGAGLALLVLAAGVRDNGAAALPPLCLVIVATCGTRRRLVTLAAAFGLFVAVTACALLANHALTQARDYAWYRSVAIEDLAGTICNERPMSDAEVRELLAGIPLQIDSDLQRRICKVYTPRVWFTLSAGEGRAFLDNPDKAERIARRDAWLRAVTEHTRAYLAHRLAVSDEVLGLTSSPPWEPVCQSFAANPKQLARISHDASLSWFETTLGRWFIQRWSPHLFYRPWAYGVVALILLAYTLIARDGLLAALAGSGLLYELSIFAGTSAPDFRYSHWMVTCTCLVAATVFFERLRAGLAARKHRTG